MFYYETDSTVYDSIEDFKRAYSNTSFGHLQTEEDRNAIGLYSIENVYPDHDKDFQTVNSTGVIFENGKYRYSYVVVSKELSTDERNSILSERFLKVLEENFDLVARQRNYDNRITCSIRAGYPGPYRAEGEAFGLWMDTCNSIAYQLQNDIINGQKQIPTSNQDFLSNFPLMVWPT